MEVICLDSSVLIEYYRIKDKSKSFLFALTKNYQFNIPAVVKYEILRGDKKKDDFWIAVFKHITILPFDSECATLAAQIYMTLKSQNKLTGTDDIFIAATALRNKLKIATINSAHFKRIAGIETITPENFKSNN